MTERKTKPPKNNPVHKHMEEFNRPETLEPRTNYKRKPKGLRPVHEIDPHDPYIDEEDIWNE